MKISELIKHAQRALKLDGDLEIKLSDTESDGEDSTSPLAGIATLCDERQKPQYFVLCDDDTMDMFHSGS